MRRTETLQGVRMIKFLGSYNLFHARKTNAGDAGVASPADAGGVTLVRPHDIEIRRENSDGFGIAARINHFANHPA
jgi:hypothetical protein